MKPRSTVRALLAVTEMLLAARKRAGTKVSSSGTTPRDSKVIARLFGRIRPLLLSIKPQAVS